MIDRRLMTAGRAGIGRSAGIIPPALPEAQLMAGGDFGMEKRGKGPLHFQFPENNAEYALFSLEGGRLDADQRARKLTVRWVRCIRLWS